MFWEGLRCCWSAFHSLLGKVLGSALNWAWLLIQHHQILRRLWAGHYERSCLPTAQTVVIWVLADSVGPVISFWRHVDKVLKSRKLSLRFIHEFNSYSNTEVSFSQSLSLFWWVEVSFHTLVVKKIVHDFVCAWKKRESVMFLGIVVC